VKVHPSALKHGGSSEDAIEAAEWSLWIEPLDENNRPPDRELRLGFDIRALLLETVVLVFESGDEMGINALPARRKYLDLLPHHRDQHARMHLGNRRDLKRLLPPGPETVSRVPTHGATGDRLEGAQATGARLGALR